MSFTLLNLTHKKMNKKDTKDKQRVGKEKRKNKNKKIKMDKILT